MALGPSLVLTVAGCGGASAVAAPRSPPPSSVPARAPTPHGRETASTPEVQRIALLARVGQDGVPAIVRDVRRVEIAAATSTLTFRALPVDFDIHGVSLREVGATATSPAQDHRRLEIVSLRASGTTSTAESLASGHIGKRVRVWKGRDGTSWDEGVLVGVTGQRALVAVNGDVTSTDLEHVSLSGAPSEPSLEANVTGTKGPADAELTYATAQIRSTVGYRLVRHGGSSLGALGGDATISNDSGIDMPDTSFIITADAPSPRDFAQGGPSKSAGASDTTAIRFTNRISVPAGRSVATRLFGPSEVALTRRIVIEGMGLPIYAGTPPGEMSNASVRAVVDATNVTGGKLSAQGMLPGATELFDADAQATDPPRWYGSTASRPLPGGIGLRIDLGDEKQFETQRRMVAMKSLGRCVSESTWEVSVTNPTEEPLPFEDVEPVTGDYSVLESSLPATAKEKDYFGFAFPVAGKSTVRLKFRVRVTSCVERSGSRGYWYTGKPSGKGKPS